MSFFQKNIKYTPKKDEMSERRSDNPTYHKVSDVNFNCYVKLNYKDHVQLFDKWNPYKIYLNQRGNLGIIINHL